MSDKIKKLNKKTKLIILAVGLITVASLGGVTACTMIKSNTGDDKIVATESATESTEQATEAATEQPTEEETEEPTEQATENPTEEVTEQPTEKPTEKKDKENEKKEEEATVVQTTTTIVGDNQTNSNNNSNSNTNTGTATQSKPVNNNKPNNTTTTPSKVWHEAEYKTVHHPAETKKVWVVDQEGYTYEEPIYETHGVTICNDCGADITESSFRRQHLISEVKNGKTGSYRDEWREVQVGTKTITVEEKGHWETQVVKEAWDEQVLIKEAGYY